MEKDNFKKVWDDIPKTGILPKDAEARMWKNIRKKTFKESNIQIRKIVAACLVLFIGLATFYAVFKNDTAVNEEFVYRKTYDGTVQFVRLSDGSKVWVNENSSLKFPKTFSGANRTVILEGEAYFDIKEDTQKPFIIHSGTIVATSNGGKFQLNTNNTEQPWVGVSSGTVKIGDIILKSGFKAVYNMVSKALTKETVTVEEPDWKQKIIDIEGYTLAEILQDLKKDYQFNVQYEQDTIKQLKLKGTLIKQPLDSMLTTLSYALKLKITPTGVNNTYTIASKAKR